MTKKARNDSISRVIIITEGDTEKNYFEGMIKFLLGPHASRILNNVFIKSTGMQGVPLIEKAESEINRLKRRALLADIVAVVFDKDETKKDSFNKAAFSEKRLFNAARASGRTVRNPQVFVCWSNPCFEHWLMLHFKEFNACISFSMMKDYLSNAMEETLHEKYDHTNKNIYLVTSRISVNGDDAQVAAIKRARKQLDSYGDGQPSDWCPGTNMADFVECLGKWCIDQRNKLDGID